jgi:hypothetical protein
MVIQRSFFSADHDDDPYVSSAAGERALNRAIVTAEISRSYEEYLEIFDRFYAEDIEVSSATSTGQIRGKARVSSLLYDFLVPLHTMAEIGGVSVSIRHITMPGDAADETHSAWTLDLVGATGSCTASWRTLRKWKGSLVVFEHHYDEQQSGGPLTEDDLRLGDAQNPISQHARALALNPVGSAWRSSSFGSRKVEI